MRMKIFALWVLTTFACVGIVKGTKIGPTIFAVSEANGWGVHVGDFLILVPLTFAVTVTTLIYKRRKTLGI